MAEEKDTAPAAAEEAAAEEAAAEEILETSQEEEASPEEEVLAEDEQVLLQLQESLSTLDQENKELQDKLLRKQADFDNFRKRMFREKEDSIKYANSSLLSDLIAVIDDFERAIGSAESSTDFESFLSGIKLIEKQFVGMLERNWGLKRMETVGKEFDPQEHEALMMVESDECDTETVVEDYQKGYYLQDRVLRHAKVKVGTPKQGEKSEAASPKETGKKKSGKKSNK